MKLRDTLSRPWAMAPRAFREVIHRIARADQASPQDFFFLFQREEPESDLDVRDGVAVVPVRGSLFRESMSSSSWAKSHSYTGIRARLTEALDREDVRAIVLDVDSPGGEALGLAELSDFIVGARKRKPIDAVVSAYGASAAYFIASSARNVFAARDAIVGSIGTILIILDFRKWDERLGLEEIHIVSSQSPRKDPDPKTDEGYAQFKAEVDAIADVFVRSVARNRGVPGATVLSDFGQGGVFVGAEGVGPGLIDGIATLDEVVAARAEGRPVRFERPLKETA